MSGGERKFGDHHNTINFFIFSGDQYNFVRADELEHAWRIFTPLLKKIDTDRVQPEKYVFGSRGPESSDRLMTSNGFVYAGTYKWQKPEAKPAEKGGSANKL